MDRNYEASYEAGKRDQRKWCDDDLARGIAPMEISKRVAKEIAEELEHAREKLRLGNNEEFWREQIAYYEGMRSVLD